MNSALKRSHFSPLSLLADVGLGTKKMPLILQKKHKLGDALEEITEFFRLSILNKEN